jgi:hypothetical protein
VSSLWSVLSTQDELIKAATAGLGYWIIYNETARFDNKMVCLGLRKIKT